MLASPHTLYISALDPNVPRVLTTPIAPRRTERQEASGSKASPCSHRTASAQEPRACAGRPWRLTLTTSTPDLRAAWQTRVPTKPLPPKTTRVGGVSGSGSCEVEVGSGVGWVEDDEAASENRRLTSETLRERGGRDGDMGAQISDVFFYTRAINQYGPHKDIYLAELYVIMYTGAQSTGRSLTLQGLKSLQSQKRTG
jgi:hypothetical protein